MFIYICNINNTNVILSVRSTIFCIDSCLITRKHSEVTVGKILHMVDI